MMFTALLSHADGRTEQRCIPWRTTEYRVRRADAHWLHAAAMLDPHSVIVPKVEVWRCIVMSPDEMSGIFELTAIVDG